MWPGAGFEVLGLRYKARSKALSNRSKQWRDQLLEGATGVFGEAPKGDAEPRIDVKTLHAKIAELTLENEATQDFRGPTGAKVPAPMSGARRTAR